MLFRVPMTSLLKLSLSQSLGNSALPLLLWFSMVEASVGVSLFSHLGSHLNLSPGYQFNDYIFLKFCLAFSSNLHYIIDSA